MPDANNAPSPKISAEDLALTIKLEGIFLPKGRKRRDEFYERNPATGVVAGSPRFVHYTSAEAALSIISNKRIWMRNAMSMSDYREVQHGFDIFQKFFSVPSKLEKFTAALDKCVPGGAMEAIQLFNQNWNTTRFHTYITSISEHLPEENLHGRLSMWRAFGGNAARVALIFDIPWDAGGGQALNLLFSPVAYLNEQEAHAGIDEVISQVTANRDFLRSLDRQIIVSYIYVMLLAGVTCLKHEGFREEREWRAIYSPYRSPSALMKCSTKSVGGIPQSIYEIPLDERVSPALAGLEFSRIFDRLIIGPSPYSWPMYEAFTTALTDAGIPKEVAQQRVVISGIPIRV